MIFYFPDYSGFSEMEVGKMTFYLFFSVFVGEVLIFWIQKRISPNFWILN